MNPDTSEARTHAPILQAVSPHQNEAVPGLPSSVESLGVREMTPEEPQGSGTKGPPERAGSQQGTACSGNRTGINRVRPWTARTISDQLAPGAGVCLIS